MNYNFNVEIEEIHMTAPLTKKIEQINESSTLTDIMKTVQSNEPLNIKNMCGSDVNQKDHFGFTALYWAISHNNFKNVLMLLDFGATLEVSTSQNALFYAISCDNLEVLKYFIEKGIDTTITCTTQQGDSYTLLEYAKKLKRKAIVEYLR